MNGRLYKLLHPGNTLRLENRVARLNKSSNGHRVNTSKNSLKRNTKNEFANLKIVSNSRNALPIKADIKVACSVVLPVTRAYSTYRRTSPTRKGVYISPKNAFLSYSLKHNESEGKLFDIAYETNNIKEKKYQNICVKAKDNLNNTENLYLHELTIKPDCSLCLKGSPKELCTKESSVEQKRLKLKNKVNAGTVIDKSISLSNINIIKK